MSSEYADAGIPRAPRYDSLDIWRGVACLAVVVFHVAAQDRRVEAVPAVSAVLAKLWLGVPMFFVISGYCIAATCDSSRRRDRSFAWYMQRRVRRIFPVLGLPRPHRRRSSSRSPRRGHRRTFQTDRRPVGREPDVDRAVEAPAVRRRPVFRPRRGRSVTRSSSTSSAVWCSPRYSGTFIWGWRSSPPWRCP